MHLVPLSRCEQVMGAELSVTLVGSSGKGAWAALQGGAPGGARGKGAGIPTDGPVVRRVLRHTVDQRPPTSSDKNYRT